MREKLFLFLKGIILGVAFVIPGVSGGTLAVLLGIYEELIEAASNFYKGIANFKKYFMYLFPLGLGVVFSVGLCAKIIKIGLEKAPIVTMLIFLGLIIGGIPKLFKSLEKRVGLKEISFMLVGLVIVIGMMFIDNGDFKVSFDNMNALSYFLLFLVGIVASATMVVPGISGSFTLMLIGYYEPILDVVNDLASFINVSENLLIMLPFILGILIGIVVIAKIIQFCLNRYRNITYYVILGFVLSSVISVFYEVSKNSFILSHWIIGVLLMIIDSLFIYKVFDK